MQDLSGRTTYTYDGAARVSGVTQPGFLPITYSY